MENYTIRDAYPEPFNTCDEVEIKSDSLIYCQIGYTHHGLQCSYTDKRHDIILKKCSQIAKLIKDIDNLNKK